MKRRDFLKTTGAGAAAAGIGMISGKAEAAGSTRIQKYGTLGRTGLKISDISFGGGGLSSPSLMARAVDMGINYFDTAPDYGPSEATMGKYLKQSGGRDKVIIVSKFCEKGGYPAHLQADEPEDNYIDVVEGSLKRLKTDYLDAVFVHAMGEDSRGYEDRLFSTNMLNAYEKLKKAGKVRFLAVSSHGPTRMEELLMKAVKSGHYDFIMPSHNFLEFPNVPEVIREAGRRDIGVVAMKTLAGAKDMDLDPGDEPFPHAAFNWVLRNRDIAGLIVTIKNVRDLKHYVEASGKGYSKRSQRTLEKYKLAYSREYCRTGCGECLGSCPEGVNIPTVLRHEMYFSDYSEQKKAMTAYSNMSPKADICSSCEGASCRASCPFGLPVKEMMGRAHKNLSFMG